MGDAGVVGNRDRLPWLEPYRAPSAKPSNRKAGLSAAIGVIGLTAVVTLLNRDLPWPAADTEREASVALPAPTPFSPPVEAPSAGAPLASENAAEPSAQPVRQAPATASRRRTTAEPRRDSFRQVAAEQADLPLASDSMASEAVLAIAALPLPPDPPRPVVNPAAQVVRGRTVQLGVYVSSRQAEAAWRSAISDYTYLVTMPKSIEAIRYGQKRFYRLQLGTPSRQHARQLCSNLKSIGRACTVA
ncbi:SPOR domain-containing protein [Sphingomonas xanthus]|uniref:SPOR domain-containing protein n=1 Tax=Sphingomonas xanthus TaxID=2594473 RepID=A0A516IQH0_9SPHN|nr:SPOR domain-containing protein [Sphingomonas xanthus]QDP19147.1 hypothetical protein FMM02_03715 [Sphingomonas xanthus]